MTRGARRAAALVVVRAIDDLAVGDSGEPGHQRLAIGAAKLVQMLERLEERRLQDVAGFEPLAQ